MSEWRPIETAPKNGESVMVSDGANVGESSWINGRWVQTSCGTSAWEGEGDRGGLADLDIAPTHWMPLPDPPKQGE